jgi:pilus assembly protein CpaC
VGALFRSTEFQKDQSELMFVVTPHLVKPIIGPVMLPTDVHVAPSSNDAFFNGKGEGSAPLIPPAPVAPVAPAPAPMAPQPAARPSTSGALNPPAGEQQSSNSVQAKQIQKISTTVAQSTPVADPTKVEGTTLPSPSETTVRQTAASTAPEGEASIGY